MFFSTQQARMRVLKAPSSALFSFQACVFRGIVTGMNALWITRMSSYRNSPEALLSAKVMVQCKVHRQAVLLRRYHKAIEESDMANISSLPELLLYEARMAKQFWRHFRTLIPAHTPFSGRTPQALDAVNRLLDIGYHHLASCVRTICDRYDIPTALGLLHVAQSADSTPLVYDLMELFRSDSVDAETLRFLRLKKKPLVEVGQKEIGHFLHEVNARLLRKQYLKDFKICHTYRYYMEVQILKFVKAVNHGEVFSPVSLPARHESRCRSSRALDRDLLSGMVDLGTVPRQKGKAIGN